MTCVDTPDWNNFSGRSCADYGATWCFGGAARPGHEWTLGATFNFPEQHCCACGKPYTTAAARAALPKPIAPPIDAPFEEHHNRFCAGADHEAARARRRRVPRALRAAEVRVLRVQEGDVALPLHAPVRRAAALVGRLQRVRAAGDAAGGQRVRRRRCRRRGRAGRRRAAGAVRPERAAVRPAVLLPVRPAGARLGRPPRQVLRGARRPPAVEVRIDQEPDSRRRAARPARARPLAPRDAALAPAARRGARQGAALRRPPLRLALRGGGLVRRRLAQPSNGRGGGGAPTVTLVGQGGIASRGPRHRARGRLVAAGRARHRRRRRRRRRPLRREGPVFGLQAHRAHPAAAVAAAPRAEHARARRARRLRARRRAPPRFRLLPRAARASEAQQLRARLWALRAYTGADVKFTVGGGGRSTATSDRGSARTDGPKTFGCRSRRTPARRARWTPTRVVVKGAQAAAGAGSPTPSPPVSGSCSASTRVPLPKALDYSTFSLAIDDLELIGCTRKGGELGGREKGGAQAAGAPQGVGYRARRHRSSATGGAAREGEVAPARWP